MHTLNHANLTTCDVPALQAFFERNFDLWTIEIRGEKFAILQDSKGFLLALMFDKHMTRYRGYPSFFTSASCRIRAFAWAAGYEAPTPAMLQRGGPPTYGFYCDAPGGVMVEVSTMNV